jgi:hypothetical protein
MIHTNLLGRFVTYNLKQTNTDPETHTGEVILIQEDDGEIWLWAISNNEVHAFEPFDIIWVSPILMICNPNPPNDPIMFPNITY